MRNQSKLFGAGLKPVYRVMSKDGQEIKPWKRIPTKLTFSYDESEEIFTLKWNFPFTGDKSHLTYFSYTYPYSLSEMSMKLDQLEQMGERKNIYVKRETICYSLEGRPMEMLTISSKERISPYEEDFEPTLPNLFPECLQESHRCKRFYEKKTIVISGRVHPGESGASYMFNGLIDLILE